MIEIYGADILDALDRIEERHQIDEKLTGVRKLKHKLYSKRRVLNGIAFNYMNSAYDLVEALLGEFDSRRMSSSRFGVDAQHGLKVTGSDYKRPNVLGGVVTYLGNIAGFSKEGNKVTLEFELFGRSDTVELRYEIHSQDRKKVIRGKEDTHLYEYDLPDEGRDRKVPDRDIRHIAGYVAKRVGKYLASYISYLKRKEDAERESARKSPMAQFA